MTPPFRPPMPVPAHLRPPAPPAPPAAEAAPAVAAEPPFSNWHRAYRLITLAGIAGLAALSTPVLMDLVHVHPSAWGAVPAVLITQILVGAAFSSRAHLRLVVAGVGLFFAVVAILGLLPICPDAPWGPERYYYRFTQTQLLWRVAIGPPLFIFPVLTAFAWCGEELRRLAVAADWRQPLQMPAQPHTALTGDHRKGVLQVFTVTPVVAFGLFGLIATTGLMSHSSYPFPQFLGFLWIFPLGVVAALLYGLFFGNHRETVLACGASAGISLATLAFFGMLTIQALFGWNRSATWGLTIVYTPIVVLLAVCGWSAVALIPVEIPHLLPLKIKAPRRPPEEDLGVDNRWDEAPRA